MDATRSPKTIDITIIDGPNKGEIFKGIYELKDDTYKLCGSQPVRIAPRNSTASLEAETSFRCSSA